MFHCKFYGCGPAENRNYNRPRECLPVYAADDYANGCNAMNVLVLLIYVVLLTLSAHTREGYSSHFVCQSVSQSVCVSLFDFGEGAVFRVETYISTF